MCVVPIELNNARENAPDQAPHLSDFSCKTETFGIHPT